MKILFTLGVCALSLTFFSSCSDLTTSGGYAPGAVRPSPSGINLLRTDSSRWSYDPYRRSYYDQTSRRYYDSSNRRYHSSTPRRYDQASYPRGYRRGSTISCPDYLPNVRSSNGRDSQRGYDYGRDREDRKKQEAAYVKQAYKNKIDQENAEFDALLKRKKAAYDRQLSAEARAYKSRPRSQREAAAYKQRVGVMKRNFKNEIDRLKVQHKNHVDAHLEDYRRRVR